MHEYSSSFAPSTSSGSTSKPAMTMAEESSPVEKSRKGKGKRKTRPGKKSTKTSERPHLTESEKKNNHITSEQKRRQNIRIGYDRLSETVPRLEGLARSEAYVLQETVAFGRALVTRRLELIRTLKERGLEVKPEWEYQVVPDLFLEVSPIASPERSESGGGTRRNSSCSETVSIKSSPKNMFPSSSPMISSHVYAVSGLQESFSEGFNQRPYDGLNPPLSMFTDHGIPIGFYEDVPAYFNE